MLSTVPGSELVNACQILFSPHEGSCSIEFIKSLNPSALKKVYRKKALETHPDRCRIAGMKKKESSDEFCKIQSAYEVLKPVAAGEISWTEPKVFNSTLRKKSSDVFYNGGLPLRKLLFGQFLYYSGIITWTTLIQAIAWQRRGKMAYGQIALKWGMLSADEISHIIQNKKPREKFGEYAKKYNFLTIFQHLAIMGKQNKQNTLFGEYFIKKGLLTKRQVDKILEKAINHNNRVDNHN